MTLVNSKKFIDKLGKLLLEGKMFAVSDTHIGRCIRDFEKTVKKISEKASGLRK